MTVEIIILLIVLGILIWVLYSTVIGSAMGAPYVVTPDKILLKILTEAKLKPGDSFWDLGCGDGRVVKEAMNKYKVKGFGVEINPLLALTAKLKGIKILVNNFLDVDLKNADVIYMYLGPGIVEQVAEKLEKENTKPVKVISRRFEIKRWKNKLITKIPDGENWVYFYKI